MAGQPVVGVAGSSYGGALALMLGATDHRIGAVAADITWNNLGTALFPNAAGSAAGRVQEALGRLPVLLRFRRRGRPAAATAAGRSVAGIRRRPGRRLRPVRPAAVPALPAGRRPARRWTPALAGLLADSSPASVLTGCGRRRCSPRASRTRCSGWARPTRMPGSWPRPAPRCSCAGAPAAMTHPAPVTMWPAGKGSSSRAAARPKRRSPASSCSSQAGAGISATNGRRVDSTLRAAGYPDGTRRRLQQQPGRADRRRPADQRAGRWHPGGGDQPARPRPAARHRAGPGRRLPA